MVTFDYCTPDTGYEPNVMELGTNELNNAASGDIYFQDSLEDTVSLSNPDIGCDGLAKLLEQDRRILQEELLRLQQQDFREVHQQDLMKMKELEKFSKSTLDEFT